MLNLYKSLLFKLCIIGNLVVFSGESQAVPVQVGDLNGIDVRAVLQVTNNTGQNANDLHFQVYQTDLGVSVNGARADAIGFNQGSANLSDRDENPQNDGNNHQANFNFSDGNVADGDQIRININLFLTKQNMLYIDDFIWTNNGNNIGEEGGFGWRVDLPRMGGNGGDGTFGGGGLGGQEGGGGTDFFIHDVTLFNFSNEDVILNELKLLASMTLYDDLVNDIPWNLVDPIDLSSSPFIITAQSAFTFEFNTIGDYFGGHIYLNYNFDNHPKIVFGDHPVELPEPSAIALMGIGLLVFFVTRRRFK